MLGEFYSARCGLSRSPGTSSRGRCRPPSIAPVGRNENLTNPDTCGIRNASSRLCPAGSIRRAFSFARAAPACGATSPARPNGRRGFLRALRLDADRVLAELVRIAFADIGNLVDWGPDGVTLKPKRELSADDRAAVAEVAAGAGKGGAGPRLRLHSKPRALDAIARHFGLYGKTAHRFAPPGRYEGKSARALLREKLEAMHAARDAPSPDSAEQDG